MVFSKYIVMTQINENLGQGGRCVPVTMRAEVVSLEKARLHDSPARSVTVLTPRLVSLQSGHGLPLGRFRHSSARNVLKRELLFAVCACYNSLFPAADSRIYLLFTSAGLNHLYLCCICSSDNLIRWIHSRLTPIRAGLLSIPYNTERIVW